MVLFFFDDHPNIVLNPGVKAETLIFRVLAQAGFGQAAFPASLAGRLVSWLCAEFYFSGFNPFAFKLINLVIHCLNGV